jgi:UDP-N-acetylglucosamine--N-acetylmuramyl-(pentapeptide) pyrophosphoryl-undecaprenol N-acetylglucosamine transferase
MAVKAIFSGGGTGGHIYPALALIKEFRKRRPDSEVLYVGTGGIESKIVPENKIAFRQLAVMGHKRGSFFSAFKEIFCLYRAVREAMRIIKEFKPDFVLGTGGYVSMPSSIAAKLMGVRVFLHEQNAAPGLSNRLINLFAEKTFTSYEAAASRFIFKSAVRLCGNPVRREIIETRSDESYEFFGFDPSKKTILIFGGSIGASSINRAAASLIKDLMAARDDLQVIFITGERDYNDYRYLQESEINKNKCLKLFPFLDKIYYAFKISDILICRAGATTLSEITAGGKCSVLVPYPYATDNHQYKNAMALKEKNAAFIIDDSRLNTGGELKEIIVRLLEDKNLVERTGENALKMAMPEAASLICDEIEGSLFINQGEKK